MNQLATPSGLSGVGTPGAAKVAETIPFDMATGRWGDANWRAASTGFSART
jgi:hypothetical protein